MRKASRKARFFGFYVPLLPIQRRFIYTILFSFQISLKFLIYIFMDVYFDIYF